MMLFERLLYTNADPASLAADFAERMRWDLEADRDEIFTQLSETLKARNTLAADAEALERETPTPWDCFGGTPTPEQLEQFKRERDAEAGTEAERLAAKIAALDALFCDMCRALDAEGLTLTGGKISTLKRQGMPDTLAAKFETLHRAKVATIPEAERLTQEDAAALFDGLTRQGFISGDYSAFSYYLAQQPAGNAKRTKSGLSWAGTPGEFAYFVKRLDEYNLARYKAKRISADTTPGRNTTALCLAFGIDAKTKTNKVNSALTHNVKKPRGRTAEIDAIFSALPGLNIKERKDE